MQCYEGSGVSPFLGYLRRCREAWVPRRRDAIATLSGGAFDITDDLTNNSRPIQYAFIIY